MYMRPAMGEPTTMKIVCRQCNCRYEADAVGDPEDERLKAAVQAGVDQGDWSGLFCHECYEEAQRGPHEGARPQV